MIARGTIFRNMHQPLYNQYLVFVTSKDNHATCIGVVFPDNGEPIVTWNVGIWNPSLESDRVHFPLVGHIQLDDLIVSRVQSEINKSTQDSEE